jgi:hypothetical protein
VSWGAAMWLQTLSDAELGVLEDLAAAKAAYKEDWGELSAVKSEVEYTSGLVEACKRELMEDFQAWQQQQQQQVRGVWCVHLEPCSIDGWHCDHCSRRVLPYSLHVGSRHVPQPTPPEWCLTCSTGTFSTPAPLRPPCRMLGDQPHCVDDSNTCKHVLLAYTLHLSWMQAPPSSEGYTSSSRLGPGRPSGLTSPPGAHMGGGGSSSSSSMRAMQPTGTPTGGGSLRVGSRSTTPPLASLLTSLSPEEASDPAAQVYYQAGMMGTGMWGRAQAGGLNAATAKQHRGERGTFTHTGRSNISEQFLRARAVET